MRGSRGNMGSSPGQGTLWAHPRDRGILNTSPAFQIRFTPEFPKWVHPRFKGHSGFILGSGGVPDPPSGQGTLWVHPQVSQRGPSLVWGTFWLHPRVREHWGSIPGSGDTMCSPSGQGTIWAHSRVSGHSGPIPAFPKCVHPG